MPPDFGPFTQVFERGELPVPGYLCLLNLSKPDEALTVIRRIQLALTQPGYEPALRELLGEVNWRPHLVAAVALVLMDNPQPYIVDLWSVIRAGSWVSPQLVAVAAARDPDFIATVVQRAAQALPVVPLAGLSPAERHSATGPSSTHQRSAKELSAALALCEATGQNAPWVESVRADPSMVRLLEADIDQGGDIAVHWMTSLHDILTGAGCAPSW